MEWKELVKMMPKVCEHKDLVGAVLCSHEDGEGEENCDKCSPFRERSFQVDEVDLPQLPPPKRMRDETRRAAYERTTSTIASPPPTLPTLVINEDDSCLPSPSTGSSTLSGGNWFTCGYQSQLDS